MNEGGRNEMSNKMEKPSRKPDPPCTPEEIQEIKSTDPTLGVSHKERRINP